MVQANNIHKSYDNLHVLKGVGISVAQKEIVSIVGASGAGKSTLLHIVGTLDQPDQGSVSINGQDPFGLSKKQLAGFRNEQIGFIFQFHHLLPEFSALENVCLPAFIKKADKAATEKHAEYLLDILGLQDRLSHRPSELSGGEQQRVAVARALINSPAVVLADEPSGNLDSDNSANLYGIFSRLRDELGQTFIIVTHDEELANHTDRVLTMSDGLIV
ncbi:MAG: ABC transporter ATP-binding protein [Saprospiraceae bacterium]|nr:ABC transporter ATP-binding protein [Saprospiraceae bacterium]